MGWNNARPEKVDEEVQRVAARRGIAFSRYVPDIFGDVPPIITQAASLEFPRPARVLEVIDGDTLIAAIWWDHTEVRWFTVRCNGYDAWEINQPEQRIQGLNARSALTTLFYVQPFCVITIRKHMSLNRAVGDVMFLNSMGALENLAGYMRTNGHTKT